MTTEKAKLQQKKWRENNKEKMKEYAKKWKEKNPNYGTEKYKDFLKSHPGYSKTKYEQFLAKNPTYRKSKYEQFLIENPEYSKTKYEDFIKMRPGYRYAKTRTHVLKNKYGIDEAVFEQMLEKQDRKCAICLSPQGKRKLAVDHSHATGKVRSLLCGKCNVALGMFKDDPEILMNAIKYLRSHETPT